MFQSYELKENMLPKKEDLVKGAKELNEKGWKSDFNMAGEVCLRLAAAAACYGRISPMAL